MTLPSSLTEFIKDVGLKLNYRNNAERRYINDKCAKAKELDADVVISSPIRKGRARKHGGTIKVRARHVSALRKLTSRPPDGLNRAMQTLEGGINL
jgi:hypothetical protein